MKSLTQILSEADNMQSQLMLFKRLLDQVAKSPQDKIQALVTLSNLVLGPADVKTLSKQLTAPPPLPGSRPSSAANPTQNATQSNAVATPSGKTLPGV